MSALNDKINETFTGLVVRKDLVKKSDLDIFDMAWRYLLERLRKRSEESGTPIMVIHDIGQDDEIRKLLRRFRGLDDSRHRQEAPGRSQGTGRGRL